MAQAVSAGLSERTVRDRVARGRYVRLYDGTYSIAGGEASWQGDLMALVLSFPFLAAASHKTAAYLWGMSSLKPERLEVVGLRHRRTKRSEQQVHESKDLDVSHIVPVQNIPTTSAVRTVVDLGATASFGYVAHSLDAGMRMGLFELAEIERFIARHARSGRNGIGTIRPLVEERQHWSSITESALEDRFRRLLTIASVPLPEPQFELLDTDGTFVGRFDFAYLGSRVLIEIDSEQFHLDPNSFQRDREKQNAASRLGWTLYRFTNMQMSQTPAEIVNLMRSASLAS